MAQGSAPASISAALVASSLQKKTDSPSTSQNTMRKGCDSNASNCVLCALSTSANCDGQSRAGSTVSVSGDSKPSFNPKSTACCRSALGVGVIAAVCPLARYSNRARWGKDRPKRPDHAFPWHLLHSFQMMRAFWTFCFLSCATGLRGDQIFPGHNQSQLVATPEPV